MIQRMLQWISLAVLAMPIGLFAAQPYDPLVIAKAVDIRPLDFDVQDEAPNRSLPIRVYRKRSINHALA